MPRYVVLRHDCPPGFGKPSHWDVMLERDGVLLSWSMLDLPTPGDAGVAATRLADHRVAYLDYEGPVSGDRGEVSRVASGEFRWLERTPSRIALELIDGEWTGVLALHEGDAGSWTLTRKD
jgi:hypothetical protein